MTSNLKNKIRTAAFSADTTGDRLRKYPTQSCSGSALLLCVSRAGGQLKDVRVVEPDHELDLVVQGLRRAVELGELHRLHGDLGRVGRTSAPRILLAD